jgi:creatinine amidohydrolase/Fe(II)-dependent formamide hydrolase-like protein
LIGGIVGLPWQRTEFGSRVRVFHRFHRLTASGSLGQPGAATAEQGASLLEAVVADVVAFLRDFARWPDLAP